QHLPTQAIGALDKTFSLRRQRVRLVFRFDLQLKRLAVRKNQGDPGTAAIHPNIGPQPYRYIWTLDSRIDSRSGLKKHSMAKWRRNVSEEAADDGGRKPASGRTSPNHGDSLSISVVTVMSLCGKRPNSFLNSL